MHKCCAFCWTIKSFLYFGISKLSSIIYSFCNQLQSHQYSVKYIYIYIYIYKSFSGFWNTSIVCISSKDMYFINFTNNGITSQLSMYCTGLIATFHIFLNVNLSNQYWRQVIKIVRLINLQDVTVGKDRHLCHIMYIK